ncbi:hypothetical protein TIFTF001_053748, partial [Ficus carica]
MFRGRPRLTRFPSQGECIVKKYKCASCGQKGHNSKKCPNLANPSDERPRKLRNDRVFGRNNRVVVPVERPRKLRNDRVFGRNNRVVVPVERPQKLRNDRVFGRNNRVVVPVERPRKLRNDWVFGRNNRVVVPV